MSEGLHCPHCHGLLPQAEPTRLIAAVPDLLEALQRAEIKLNAYVGVCKGDKELTNTIIPMARAAIAKATGQEAER